MSNAQNHLRPNYLHNFAFEYAATCFKAFNLYNTTNLKGY